MANKRMFTMKIVDSDAFLDMPLSSQCLYFHLNMRADDDGFIDNPKRIMKVVGASEDDLKLLIAKRFVLAFDNGVIVIKHWRMHNTLSQNRYHQTQYLDEKSMLKLKENGSYSFEIGMNIDDEKLIEMSKRQSRRTIDEQETDADLGLGLGSDSDIDSEQDIDSDLIKEIVDYLNLALGTNYRHTTKKTVTCIKARLNEKFTVDDFKTVIDKKCADWLGDEKMKQYLRPETLFGTKFEGYLNQTVTERRKSNKPASVGYDWDNL